MEHEKRHVEVGLVSNDLLDSSHSFADGEIKGSVKDDAKWEV